MRLTESGSRRTPVVPRVAAGCVGFAALLAAALWMDARQVSEPESTPTTSTTAAPTSTVVVIPSVTLTRPSTTTTAVMPVPEKDHTAPDAAKQVDDAVREFVAAWLLRDPPEARRVALTPWASPALVSALADVPADVLPQSTVTQVTVVSVNEMSAETAVVMSDGMRLRVSLTNTGASAPFNWKVTTYGKANQ